MLTGSGTAFSSAEIKGRFELHRSGDNFIRMDNQTGVVSVCAETNDIWQCTTAKDDYVGTVRQIEKLQKENRRLKRLMADKSGKLGLPDDRELDRVMGMFEKMMRRFLEFSKDVKKLPQENL